MHDLELKMNDLVEKRDRILTTQMRQTLLETAAAKQEKITCMSEYLESFFYN